MKVMSAGLEKTEETAIDFVNFVEKKGQGKGAQIVGLFGDLGAGKTTFAQAIGRYLGIKEKMTSPTFVIEKIYNIYKNSSFKKLVHIDAYRLQNGEELLKLNFTELANDPRNLILIEWPENVESALPENILKIHFKFIDEKTREIIFDSN